MTSPWTDPLFAGPLALGVGLTLGMAGVAARGERVRPWLWIVIPLGLAGLGSGRAAWLALAPVDGDGLARLAHLEEVLIHSPEIGVWGWLVATFLACFATWCASLAAIRSGWAEPRHHAFGIGVGGGSVLLLGVLAAWTWRLGGAPLAFLALALGVLALVAVGLVARHRPEAPEPARVDLQAGVFLAGWSTVFLGGGAANLVVGGSALSLLGRASYGTTQALLARPLLVYRPSLELGGAVALAMLVVTALLFAGFAPWLPLGGRRLGAALGAAAALVGLALVPTGLWTSVATTHAQTAVRFAAVRDANFDPVAVETGRPLDGQLVDAFLSERDLVFRGQWLCDLGPRAGGAPFPEACRIAMGQPLGRLPRGTPVALLAQRTVPWGAVRAFVDEARSNGVGEIRLVGVTVEEPVLVDLPEGEYDDEALLHEVVGG